MIYFYGEDSNLTALFANSDPDVPAATTSITSTPTVSSTSSASSGGNITTKSGMSYRVLALDKYSKHMSLPVLRALHKLVEQGAVVAGEKPVGTPSLADDAAEFKKLNDELFGEEPACRRSARERCMQGRMRRLR